MNAYATRQRRLAGMSAWTVTIETPEEMIPDGVDFGRVLLAFDESFHGRDDVVDTSTSVNMANRTLSATVTVEAPTESDTALAVCFAHWRAIADADLELHEPSRVQVTRADEDEA